MLLGLLDMKMLANNSTQACKTRFKQVDSARIVINCKQCQFELPNKQKKGRHTNASKFTIFEIVLLTDVAAIFYG